MNEGKEHKKALVTRNHQLATQFPRPQLIGRLIIDPPLTTCGNIPKKRWKRKKNRKQKGKAAKTALKICSLAAWLRWFLSGRSFRGLAKKVSERMDSFRMNRLPCNLQTLLSVKGCRNISLRTFTCCLESFEICPNKSLKERNLGRKTSSKLKTRGKSTVGGALLAFES